MESYPPVILSYLSDYVWSKGLKPIAPDPIEGIITLSKVLSLSAS